MLSTSLQLPLGDNEALTAVSAGGSVACAVSTLNLYVISVGGGQSPSLTLTSTFALAPGTDGIQAMPVVLAGEGGPSCGVVTGVASPSGSSLATLTYQVDNTSIGSVDVSNLACQGSLDDRLDVHGAESGVALVAAVGAACSITVPLKLSAPSSPFGTPSASSYASDFGVSTDFTASQSCFSYNRLFYLFADKSFGTSGAIASYHLSTDGRYGATPHAFAVTEIEAGLCAGGYSSTQSESAFTYFDNHVDGNETYWANPTTKVSTAFRFLVEFPSSVLLQAGSYYDVDANAEPVALAGYFEPSSSQYKVVVAGLRGSGMLSDVLSFSAAVTSQSGKVVGGGGGVVQANGPTNGAYVVGSTDFSYPKQNAVLYLIQTTEAGTARGRPALPGNNTTLVDKRSTCTPTSGPPVPAHCTACPPGISSICGPMLSCSTSSTCCYNSADSAYCCSQAPSGFPSCAS